MKLGMIGLGRMGLNMARRLLRGGHQVSAYNRTRQKTEEIVNEGAEGVYDLHDLSSKLDSPRIVWIMLPAGKPIDDTAEALTEVLTPGDIIVDGGNTHYKDDIRREDMLSQKGIKYVDAGVSGGIWGLKIGYCLMYGGDKETCDYLEPIFKTLAPPEGHLYCGPTGAGHFVKMVHNGIEYGMMQAYAEGFSVLEHSPYAESLDYGKVSHLWNQGSVIRSWLLELAEAAFADDPKLSRIKGYVDDSGEGRWTILQAVESGVPVPVIAAALFSRFSSRQENAFADRVLAALRKEFGGHAVVSADKE